jgi:multimeric flavodoxin WrbA
MNIWEFLIKIQGIIGALLGVIVSLVTTYWLKYSGQIKTSVDDWDIYYMYQDEYHNNGVKTKNLSQAETVGFKLEIFFYNSSEVHKSLKNIVLNFGDDFKKEIITVVDLPPRKYVKKEVTKVYRKGIEEFTDMLGEEVYLVADYIERTFILTNKERKLKTKIGVVDFE